MKKLFISKTLFFPEKGILAIGDLHIGFEEMLNDMGLRIPKTQIKNMLRDLKDIFNEIEKRGFVVKKVVFLGDIKHFFNYKSQERNYFLKILDFIKTKVKEKDIILIKGNHDTFDFVGMKMKNFYVQGDLAFTHGHKDFKTIQKENIKTIVIGHLHPSVILSEKKGVKSERFKCFLEGRYKGKNFIILPSFFDINDGTPVNYFYEEYEDHFSILPRRVLMNFDVYIVGDDVYGFGKVKDFN